MKKLTIFCIAIVSFYSFISCSINSEIYFYKDKTTTTEMDVDMKSLFMILQDSALTSLKKGKINVEKFPRTYKSFYDIELAKGRKDIPKDSARLYKKMFLKSNFEKDEIVGFSIKLDRFSREDARSYGSREENDLPMNTSILENWDGKTLKIYTSAFISEAIQDLLKMMNAKEGTSSKAEEPSMNFTTTLKFEKPIKSFKGNHPWVKQVDKKTVRIHYSLDDIPKADEKPLPNSTIEIVTD